MALPRWLACLTVMMSLWPGSGFGQAPGCAAEHDRLLALLRQGKPDQAAALGERALRRTGKERCSDALSGAFLQALARLYAASDGAKAASYALRAIELFGGDDDPRSAAALNALGEAYEAQDRPDDAEEAHRRSLALREATPKDERGLIEGLNALGISYDRHRKFALALPLYERALKLIGPAARLEGKPGEAAARGRRELLAAAEDAYKRVLAIRQELEGEGTELSDAFVILGRFYRVIDRRAEAERAFFRALELLDATGGNGLAGSEELALHIADLIRRQRAMNINGSVELARHALALGRRFEALGRISDGGAWYADSRQMLERNGAPDELMAEVLEALGRNLIRQDQLGQSATIFGIIAQRWERNPELGDYVLRSRTALDEIERRRETPDALALVAAARRHNDLLQRVAALEANAGASGDEATVRSLVEAYAALLGYEQATSFGTELLERASRAVERFAELSAPGDTGMIARVKAGLYLVMRAFPEAARWLAQADDSAETAMMRAILAALGQDRFAPVESFAVGDLVVAVLEARAAPPHPKLLWPARHFIVAPFAGAPAHRTFAFALARQGPAEAPRWYLHLHSLNRARLITWFGAQRPDDAVVRDWVVTTLTEAIEANRP